MISLRLIVFLLSGNKHFFVGKWINVQWILFSRSRTVNFPYIVPSPAGPRVSPYSSESPDQLPVGLLGQLVDCCNGITYRKGTRSNHVQVWILLRLSFHNCTEKLPLLITSIIFFTFFLHPVVLIYNFDIEYSLVQHLADRLEARSLCTCSPTVDSNPDEETLFTPSSLCHWRKKKDIILTIWADWTNHGSAN